MNNKKYIIILIIGIIMLLVAGYLLMVFPKTERVTRTIPFVLIGIGSGAIGHAIGFLIKSRLVGGDKELQESIEIEEKDERNIAIMSLAKSKAYDAMTLLFGGLLLIFAIMEVEVAVIILLVAAYLIVHAIALFYRFKFDKEM